MSKKYLSIDCESCPLINTDSCDDCLVTFICDRDPEAAVIVSLEEWKSMKSMTKSDFSRNYVIPLSASEAPVDSFHRFNNLRLLKCANID